MCIPASSGGGGRGVSAQGGFCQGMSAQEGVCLGVSAQGGFCPWSVCLEGVSAQGGVCIPSCTGADIPCGQNDRQVFKHNLSATSFAVKMK